MKCILTLLFCFYPPPPSLAACSVVHKCVCVCVCLDRKRTFILTHYSQVSFPEKETHSRFTYDSDGGPVVYYYSECPGEGRLFGLIPIGVEICCVHLNQQTNFVFVFVIEMELFPLLLLHPPGGEDGDAGG